MQSLLKKPHRYPLAFVSSKGLLRIPDLQTFLPECEKIVSGINARRGEFDVVLGWGYKHSTNRARDLAIRRALPYVALEDGFLRSVLPGVSGERPLSVVVDDLGIYYDATKRSRLEQLLEAGGWETSELLSRSRNAIDRIVQEQLSKYNHAPGLDKPLPGQCLEKVLVVDQTVGDCSVIYGMATADTFKQMLTSAVVENPEADIVVKGHPDVLAGKKTGYLTHVEKFSPRVHIVHEEINPLSLIKQVDRVYTVSSQMGFEALMVGKPVDCFGVPFYSGWGLTRDRQSIDRRTRQRNLEELFAAAYILYPRYIDPYHGNLGTIEDVLDYLTLQTRHQRVLLGKTLLCDGVRWWKRPYLRKVLFAPGNNVCFGTHSGFRSKPDKIVVWGDGDQSPLVHEAARQKIPVIRMEDGFLRSVGLGSNLVQPVSLVIDCAGIYFDPSRPSDLENILLETCFDDELLQRADTLRWRIVNERLSKYNVGDDSPLDISAGDGQNVILVPGQVEDDASIRLGCVDINTNLGLLNEVRKQNPAAYIIYKPHPDVHVGNRHGGISDQKALEICDQVVTEHSMPACLQVVNEVHTLTSLAGFEALLHGKKVTCYGLPFYAGWGLTDDKHPLPRRARALTLEELLAGTLIIYPRYIDWSRGVMVPVEVALDQLLKDRRLKGSRGRIRKGKIGQWVRKFSGFFAAYRQG